MATRADFRPGGSFPEFVQAPDSLVDAKIADAAALLDSAIFGAFYDKAVGYLAAHLMALSPWGQSARLVAKDGSTIYGQAFEEIAIRFSGGYRLAGQPGAVADLDFNPFNPPPRGPLL